VLDACRDVLDFLGRAALHACVPDRLMIKREGKEKKKEGRRTTGRIRGSAIIGVKMRRGKARRNHPFATYEDTEDG